MSGRSINLERLSEATDEQLATAYRVTLVKAHDAPKSVPGEGWPSEPYDSSDAWARFSREANRIGNEIDRRKAGVTRMEGYEGSAAAEEETAVARERQRCATIAESFSKDYDPEVGKMALRIAEVIRRQRRPT